MTDTKDPAADIECEVSPKAVVADGNHVVRVVARVIDKDENPVQGELVEFTDGKSGTWWALSDQYGQVSFLYRVPQTPGILDFTVRCRGIEKQLSMRAYRPGGGLD